MSIHALSVIIIWSYPPYSSSDNNIVLSITNDISKLFAFCIFANNSLTSGNILSVSKESTSPKDKLTLFCIFSHKEYSFESCCKIYADVSVLGIISIAKTIAKIRVTAPNFLKFFKGIVLYAKCDTLGFTIREIIAIITIDNIDNIIIYNKSFCKINRICCMPLLIATYTI